MLFGVLSLSCGEGQDGIAALGLRTGNEIDVPADLHGQALKDILKSAQSAGRSEAANNQS